MRETVRLVFVVFLTSLTCVGAAPGSSDDSDLSARIGFLRTNGSSPTDYIVSKLQDHRIVILGISVLRSAGWPYEEYLDILKATWEVNRAGAENCAWWPSLRVLKGAC